VRSSKIRSDICSLAYARMIAFLSSMGMDKNSVATSSRKLSTAPPRTVAESRSAGTLEAAARPESCSRYGRAPETRSGSCTKNVGPPHDSTRAPTRYIDYGAALFRPIVDHAVRTLVASLCCCSRTQGA
jgi:hypothetical protein